MNKEYIREINKKMKLISYYLLNVSPKVREDFDLYDLENNLAELYQDAKYWNDGKKQKENLINELKDTNERFKYIESVYGGEALRGLKNDLISILGNPSNTYLDEFKATQSWNFNFNNKEICISDHKMCHFYDKIFPDSNDVIYWEMTEDDYALKKDRFEQIVNHLNEMFANKIKELENENN